jgi:hypothetical protein
MNYKAIIPSQNIRFHILKLLRFVPDKIMLSLQYYIKMGKMCNFRRPTTWTEKLQLYKMLYRNPLLGTCVDKYMVREYITKKGLADNLVKLYGVYGNANEIDFETLPSQFILKTTDGGGGSNVIIVRDKSLLDISSLRKKLNSWINIKDINAAFKGKKIPDYKLPRLNWHYFSAVPDKDAKNVKIVVTGRFGQKWECEVDMSKYAGVKVEKMVREDLPDNAVQLLRNTGIYKM